MLMKTNASAAAALWGDVTIVQNRMSMPKSIVPKVRQSRASLPPERVKPRSIIPVLNIPESRIAIPFGEQSFFSAFISAINRITSFFARRRSETAPLLRSYFVLFQILVVAVSLWLLML